MEQRSGIYKKTAYRLMMDNYCNQSVVCYYYSVLQQMMYILAEKAYDPVPYSVRVPEGIDRHSWLCDKIKERIPSYKYSSEFEAMFNELKDYRHDADYETRTFTKEDCLVIQELVNSILGHLRYVKKAA